MTNLPLKHSFSSGFSAMAFCTIIGILWYATLGGNSGLIQLNTYLIFCLFALSIDFLWGYGGMLSFGQAAFFGLGSYSYAIVTTGRIAEIPPAASLIGLVIGIFVPVLVALLLGYFMFYGKVTGPYFTIVTLAMAYLLISLTSAWPSLFGGWTGIANVQPIALTVFENTFSITGAKSGFIMVTILIGLTVFFLRWILLSPLGLLIDGLSDNEERLEFLGTSIAWVKLIIFVISAAISGLAGVFYAAQSGYVAPELIGVVLSTEGVIFVAVGGRRTLFGAIIGTIIVRGVGYWFGGAFLNIWPLLMGILFVLIVLFAKKGILGIVNHSMQVIKDRVAKSI